MLREWWLIVPRSSRVQTATGSTSDKCHKRPHGGAEKHGSGVDRPGAVLGCQRGQGEGGRP